jgi:hypothetical protein
MQHHAPSGNEACLSGRKSHIQAHWKTENTCTKGFLESSPGIGVNDAMNTQVLPADLWVIFIGN